jgi:glycerol-3-phosphate O-acyltransferase
VEQSPALDLTLEQTLAPLIEERQSLATVKSQAEKRIDELSKDIKTRMMQAGEVSLPNVSGFKVELKPNERVSLVREKLLEQGVTLAQIEAATVTQTFEPKIDIRAAK